MAIDRAGRIETRGVDFIPEAERHSRPLDVGLVFFGTQMTYGSLVIGALPVAFGLNWLGSLTAIVLGTMLGVFAVGAMAVMGPKAGTNSSVTSGAFFGVRGRYIGSFITQVIDLGYFAMMLWVSTPPLVQAGHALFGLPDGAGATAAALLGFAFIVLALGIFGHATLVAYEKFTAVGNLICLLLIAALALPHAAGAPPAGIKYALGGYWPTWILAVTTTLSNSISFAPFAGDYARYVPTRTSARKMFWYPSIAMIAGCLISLLCGEAVGLAVSDPNNVTGLMLGYVPHALLLPVVLIGLIGNASNGGMLVYNGMLDLHAILWRLRRVQVAFIFAAIGLFVGYVGLIAFNLTNSILALCSLVTVLVTPWMVINVLGYLRAGGRFDPAALQAFAGGRGAYWYKAGFNPAATIAWAASVAVGLMFSSTAFFTGPLFAVSHGVDLSFLSAAMVAAILYPVLRRP